MAPKPRVQELECPEDVELFRQFDVVRIKFEGASPSILRKSKERRNLGPYDGLAAFIENEENGVYGFVRRGEDGRTVYYGFRIWLKDRSKLDDISVENGRVVERRTEEGDNIRRGIDTHMVTSPEKRGYTSQLYHDLFTGVLDKLGL